MAKSYSFCVPLHLNMNWKERYQRFKQWQKEPFDYALRLFKPLQGQGDFTQVFMSVLMIIIGIVGAIVQGFWIFWLVPIYYVISYHQLFGYGWWGTLWRTALCIWTGLTLILIIEKATNYFMNGLTDDLHTVAVMSVITLLITVIGFWIGWKKGRLVRG